MASVSPDLLDAKLAAAEAKTEAKFADLRGDMKNVGTKLDALYARVDDFIKRLDNVPEDVTKLKSDAAHFVTNFGMVKALGATVTAILGGMVALQRLGVLH